MFYRLFVVATLLSLTLPTISRPNVLASRAIAAEALEEPHHDGIFKRLAPFMILNAVEEVIEKRQDDGPPQTTTAEGDPPSTSTAAGKRGLNVNAVEEVIEKRQDDGPTQTTSADGDPPSTSTAAGKRGLRDVLVAREPTQTGIPGGVEVKFAA